MSEMSILHCEQMESVQPKVDGGNAALENDEVFIRLKTFVENLGAEKTDLANRLHEEQRCVGQFDINILFCMDQLCIITNETAGHHSIALILLVGVKIKW